MAQVESEVQLILPLVELVAPVVQHQQTSERALHEVELAETAELCSAVTAESLVPVVLRQLCRQHHPQQSEALPEMVVRRVPDSQPLAVWVDRLRLHLQLDLPQLVVVVETAAMARQVREDSAAPVAQLWSTARQVALQLVAQVATVEQMALLAASVIQLPVAKRQRLVAAQQTTEPQEVKSFRSN